MKKLVAVGLFISAIVGAAFVLPVPTVACDYRCSLDVCRGTGHQAYKRVVFFENYSILLEDEVCLGSGNGEPLYIYCNEFPCGSAKAGTLFTINGNMVYAFKVRNQQESEEVISSIGKRGFENTSTRYNGDSMPAAQFEAYHLALDKLRKGE